MFISRIVYLVDIVNNEIEIENEDIFIGTTSRQKKKNRRQEKPKPSMTTKRSRCCEHYHKNKMHKQRMNKYSANFNQLTTFSINNVTNGFNCFSNGSLCYTFVGYLSQMYVWNLPLHLRFTDRERNGNRGKSLKKMRLRKVN